MDQFYIKHLSISGYRCFESLDLSLEADVTVIFAENGGGKTALLDALAMMLGLLQPKQYKAPTLDIRRDARREGGRRRPEATHRVKVLCGAEAGDGEIVWRVKASAKSPYQVDQLEGITAAMERLRAPTRRWPLIAYYGTGRVMGGGKKGRRGRSSQDRMDGYVDCLSASASDRPLLDWLRQETFGDLARKERGEPERGFWRAVAHAMETATPELARVVYDPATDDVWVTFSNGDEVRWGELSDGYHVFLGLVGDIARRAVILNEQDGQDATKLAFGVVLIDEVDLHLHPKWQRQVLTGLRQAFPRLQWIVTTHSPQVLSSVENRQVRRLVNRQLDPNPVLIEGRDTNAILRDWMETPDRDPKGQAALNDLLTAIERGQLDEAAQMLQSLRQRWGDLDPELVYAEKLLEWERRDLTGD